MRVFQRVGQSFGGPLTPPRDKEVDLAQDQRKARPSARAALPPMPWFGRLKPPPRSAARPQPRRAPGPRPAASRPPTSAPRQLPGTTPVPATRAQPPEPTRPLSVFGPVATPTHPVPPFTSALPRSQVGGVGVAPWAVQYPPAPQGGRFSPHFTPLPGQLRMGSPAGFYPAAQWSAARGGLPSHPPSLFPPRPVAQMPPRGEEVVTRTQPPNAPPSTET